MKSSILLLVELMTLALIAWVLPSFTEWFERSLQPNILSLR